MATWAHYLASLEKLIGAGRPHSLSHPWLAHHRIRKAWLARTDRASPDAREHRFWRRWRGAKAAPRGTGGRRLYPGHRCRRLRAAAAPAGAGASGASGGSAGPGCATDGGALACSEAGTGVKKAFSRAALRPWSLLASRLSARTSMRAPIVPARRTRTTMSLMRPNQKLRSVASMRRSFSLVSTMVQPSLLHRRIGAPERLFAARSTARHAAWSGADIFRAGHIGDR